MKLKPFFSFYGSKYRAAKRYPNPTLETIIEPFAGSAGYSALHNASSVILYDKDPVIVGVWDYLIHATGEDILNLPNLTGNNRVDDLPICQEAKSLVGFWVNRGSTRPSQTRSAWMRAGKHDSSFWGQAIKERIASQVEYIRHWKVFEMDYVDIPNTEATWFIDPPYQVAGTHYKMSAKQIDYQRLGKWCRSRTGHVMVCESDGADWLPFEHFANLKGNESKNGGKVSRESVWYNTPGQEPTTKEP